MHLRTWLAAIWAFLAIAVCGAEIPVAEPESVGMSSERLLRIDAAMQRHIDAGNIQGAVTAVARRGKVVHFKAHGLMDVEAERPMSRDAIFIMMSSTKPVLGVAAMMMIEEGLIRPDDPVSKYIPEFADMKVAVLKDPADEDISPFRVDRRNPPEHRLVPAETPITIKHLLTHTSGLASGGLGTAHSRPAERVTLASYIPTLGAMALDFQPGSRWAYSGGTGLDVVARIIEIVSGMPYDEFVQTRIFDPLDMTDTHYNLPASKASRRVVIQGRDLSRWNRETTYFSGSYGLSSTARDYLHFEQMLANGGELFGNRLLGSRSVEWMASNHLGDLYRGFTQNAKGQGFGYTVAVVLDPIDAGSRRSAGAFGWGGAFGTRSWTDPAEELAGVLMLQQPHPGAQYDFENAVRQAIID
ncbi:MAG: beta-lactamase family protein [Gammaproteobacteria bacterium]|nr:beta-lactamase family protein [Gammaproteobacteria bacterium]MYJ75802.1 beta-lactamase family protein [Gammaproteobacteria bacterium]